MKKKILASILLGSLILGSPALADSWKGPSDYYGKRHGVWKRYSGANKVLEVVTYRHGVKHGPGQGFHPKTGRKYYVTTYKDGGHHGPYSEYFNNASNSQRYKGDHVDNKRTGEWTEWHENGKVKSVVRYDTGKPQGPAQFFYSSGNKYHTTSFRDGLHHGPYTEFYDNGDNSKFRAGKHQDDKRFGQWTEWHRNGKRKSVVLFFNAKPHGPAQYFYASGRKHYITNHDQGVLEGSYMEFHDNAGNTRKLQGVHRNGKRVGKWTTWHGNGNMVAEVTYANGKKHGPASYYHWVSGDPDYTVSYKNDVMNGPYVKYHFPAPHRDPTPLEAIKGTPSKALKIKAKQEGGTYVNGKKHGEWTHWFKSGARMWVKAWRHGVQEGPEIHFFGNSIYGKGLKFSGVTYKSGAMHGTYEQFHNNEGNTKSLKGTYVKGNRVGKWIAWYENGERKWTGQYDKSGRKDGFWHEFAETGEAVKVGRYKEGKLIKAHGK